MIVLPPNPSLSDLQSYMSNICQERGWTQTTSLETFLLFTEEVGELAKAIRNQRGLFVEAGTSKDKEMLELEMADVLSYLLELANKFQIDLETAFRKKEQINASRKWE